VWPTSKLISATTVYRPYSHTPRSINRRRSEGLMQCVVGERRCDVLEERISVPHSQRASRFEDGGELCIGEADRPHACPVTVFRSGIRDLASANKSWLEIANPGRLERD
jgi:hypothetical protein